MSRRGMPTKHVAVLIAILGAILFVVGLWGTVTYSAASRAASDGYFYDCLTLMPAADCAQRAAAIAAYNAQTALFEVVGIAGFLIIIAAAVLDLVLGRRRKASPELAASRP